MADETMREERMDGSEVLLTAVIRLTGADRESFERYEASVLPLIPEHGGHVERRIRAVDSKSEIHILRFPDRGSFERYQADPRRLALLPLLAQSKASIDVSEARDLPIRFGGVEPPTALDALDPRTTALLVIDVQLGFDDPVWGPRNNPLAEARIAELLAVWRDHSAPVHHVRHASTEPESPLRPSGAGYAFKGEALPCLGEPTHVKAVNSAFIGTGLEADLRNSGVTAVVLVGLTTNHCVSTTARMAANLGFQTVVVSDATATFDRWTVDGHLRPAGEVHSDALSDLAGEFAAVASAAEVSVALEAGSL